MVWIHGGAFFLGRSDNYQPDRFVERGVVVVTLNYRLGALGLLAHPALNDAQGRSGNYALADQQLAGILMWVPSCIPYLAGGLWLLWQGLARNERRSPTRDAGP